MDKFKKPQKPTTHSNKKQINNPKSNKKNKK